MTSAATQPATGTGGCRMEGHGLILFASVMLVIIGYFNLIYDIAAIANSHVFTANAYYVFGSLCTWGWITLIGVLHLAAVAGVVASSQWTRWFGVAVLRLNAIDQMFFIPALSQTSGAERCFSNGGSREVPGRDDEHRWTGDVRGSRAAGRNGGPAGIAPPPQAPKASRRVDVVGATTRGQAVARARELGLLEG